MSKRNLLNWENVHDNFTGKDSLSHTHPVKKLFEYHNVFTKSVIHY